MYMLLLFTMILGSGMRETSGYYLTGKKYNGGLVKAYETLAEKNNKDIVVTLDLPMYVLGQLFDESIYEIESTFLYDSLTALLKHILVKNRLYKYTKCVRAKEGAMLLDAYLKVPLYFLTGDESLLDREEIKKEVELIKKAGGIEISPVFKIKEDYSQYKPRSHYTRNLKMQNYFRAMMYLGRMGFYPFLIKSPEQRSKNIGAAVILSKIVSENTMIKSEYKFIIGIITTIVGKSDDVTPLDFLKIIKGYNIIPRRAVCSEDYDTKILEALKEEKSPGIYSRLVWDSDTPAISQIGVKLIGQSWVFDSYIFQNLVYDEVGTKEKPRLLPKGLDVQAVLGSEKALDILTEEYGEDRYKNYLAEMEKLQHFVREDGDSIFSTSLYHRVLGIERKYLMAKKRSPVFTYKEERYETKKLLTNLGVWALLKHATLLYGKQSYTMGITMAPRAPKNTLTLVEPYPDIIEDIRALNARLIKLTGKLKIQENFKELDKLLSLMLKVALSEENGMPSQKGMNELRFFLKHNNLLRMEDKDLDIPAKVADVHTDPNSRKVLEVATGFPFEIVYSLTEGRKAHGFVISYYEFSRNMQERLTDGEWKKLLEEGRVNTPIWIKHMVLRKDEQKGL